MYNTTYNSYSGAATLDWNQLVVLPLKGMFVETVRFLPDLVAGLLTILVGWLLAQMVRLVVQVCLRSMGFDAIAGKIGLTELTGGAEGKLAPHKWFGLAAFWWTMVVVFTVALDRFRMRMVSAQVDQILSYVVAVFMVSVIAVAGIFLSMILSRVVKGAAEAAQIGRPELFGGIAKWSVLVFTATVCLSRIGLPRDIFMVFFSVTYLTLCISFVLAFGLGGTVWAGRILERFSKK